MKKIDISALDRMYSIIAIIRFKRAYEAEEEIGWFEHTSDWDPFLIVTKTNNEVIETEAGYTDLDIINYKRDESIYLEDEKIEAIEVYVENKEDVENPIKKRIKIDDIKSIQWATH